MRKLNFLFFLLFLLNAGCDPYNKLLKSTDYDLKYKKAVEYYEKKDYIKALGLFEEILPIYRLTARGEEVFYKFTYCYYYQKDYYLAGYYFKSFTKSYPASEKAEECLFMSAMCNVKLSPPYYLDQTDTENAISDLQGFINRYPESSKRDTCNKIMDGMRFKLDTKEFENAKLYYKTENFKAAVVAFNAILETNPGTSYKETVMALRVEAAYRYALLSIPAKKAERLEQTMGFYTKFAAAFPNSEKLMEAQGFNAKAKEELKEIK